MLTAEPLRLLAGASLVGYVAADTGDDFSNNLFSDLAPLLALFGERVTMQFMSQSTGWADNIILAMAPLGIITAIVGAIRVGGPTWLRAIIGRARESRAVVEAELMSSTSHEVCELWNGRQIVRVMGVGPIREFIILMPGENDEDQGPVNGVEVKGLRDRKKEGAEAEDRYLKKHVHTFRDSIFDPSKVIEMIKSILKKKSPEPLRSRDLEGALTPDDISSNVPETNNDPGPGTKHGRPVVVIRNLDAPAPSLTLNIRNQLSRGELYLVAVFGTLLQLGVLVFSGSATYHPALRSSWLKDGNPAADYAFPCNAAGTLLLVTGVMICAHVVEGSTSETRYRPVKGEARLVWLQKSGTVNDQAFESFAIFPRQPQTLMTTSQRWDAPGSQQPILGETIAVIGAMVSLCGFVAQFVDLRGMHWSSSIAQLIAIALMVALRAWVRRNLAQLPASRRLLSGHEMDWLAMTLADNHARASWLNATKDGWDTLAGDGGDNPQDDEKLKPQSRPWDWKPTAVEDPATILALQDVVDTTNPDVSESPLQTRAQRTMMLRRDLGEVADWQGPASAEAISLARAIEIAMDTLFDTKPGQNGTKLTWHLSIPNSSEDSRMESVTFHVEQLGTGHWKAFSDELEAALSLWLYSVAELQNSRGGDLGGDEQGIKPAGHGVNEGRLEFKHMRSENDTWLRIKARQSKRSLRLLGQSTEALIRDLRWWIPRLDNTGVVAVRTENERTNSGDMVEVDNHRIVGYSSNWGLGTYIYENPIHDDNSFGYGEDSSASGSSASGGPASSSSASDNNRPTWTMAADSSIPLATLFAHHMFSAFMWAAAKKMKSHIPGGADIRPSERDNAPSSWTSFALRNAKLHKMAQDIQGTGLGSLGDIYLAIIPPLSIERKLPQPDAIIGLARKHANPHGQSRQRSEVPGAYLWLLRAAKGLQEDIIFRAVALLMEHLRAVTYTVGLLEAQHVDNSDIKLRQLKQDSEDIAKALHVVDDSVLTFLLGLYHLQGRPWTDRLPEWPQPLEISDMIPKLADLDLRKWVVGYSAESDITVILRGKARLDEKDMLDWTPLYYAIMTGPWDGIIDRCVYHGADVNARDLNGRIPLHYACQHDHPSTIQYLLRAGADINARDADGMVPLHDAARAGSGQVVGLLIEAGADVNMVDVFGNTPLHHAAYAGSKAALLGCLNHADVKLRNHNGRTALHLAAIGKNGSVGERHEVVKALMGKEGIEKEARDNDNWTPLQLAARFGHGATIEVLIEMGVDREAKDGDSYTALHYAAEYGHEAVVELLLKLGAGKETEQNVGFTPLHCAIGPGHEAVVKVFVKLGADGAKSSIGFTPLHHAVSCGHEAIVKFLVEQGTDKEAKDIWGNTPLHAAAERGREAIAKFLVEQGVDKEAKNSDGDMPLHLAAQRGHEAVVKYLVEQSADKEAKDMWGNTPLHAAAEGGHEAITKFLVNQGANKEAKNEDGSSPLDLAAQFKHEAVVKTLVE